MDAWIVEHMKSLSDDELRAVLTVDARDWRPEAIAIARAELQTRGLPEATPAEVAAIVEQRREELPTRWLTYYIWTMPAGAALQTFDVFTRDGLVTGVLALLLLLGPSVLVSWGLRKRRYWAWQINWLFYAVALFEVVARMALSPRHHLLPIVIVGLYIAASTRYFLRRRHLFD